MMRIILAILLTVMLPACSKVPAGNVGVKVYLLGKDKGVDSEILPVGRYYIGINEKLYLFPTYQQTKVYTSSIQGDSPIDESFTFQTKEGMTCNLDMGITFTVNPEKIPELFQKYRKGVEELKSIILRNSLRDALNSVTSRMTVESVYGEGKTQMISDIEKIVRNELKDFGINIERVYLIGSITLPNNVVSALNSKIEATQRAQQRENELREAEAAAKKTIAEAEGNAKAALVRAESEAKANQLKLKTLTTELINYEAIQRWDGKLPNMMGAGAVPFINLK